MDFSTFCNEVLFGDPDAVRRAATAEPGLLAARDDMGFTALHLLMTEDRPEVAALLLELGADVHAVNDQGMTALHLAQSGEVIDVLLEAGANLEARDARGATPLVIQAAQDAAAGALETMEALLMAGARTDARDALGQTALDIATSRHELEKIALLQRYRAS